VPPLPPVNTCYSWVNDREAIAVVNAYRIEGGSSRSAARRAEPSVDEAPWLGQSIWADGDRGEAKKSAGWSMTNIAVNRCETSPQPALDDAGEASPSCSACHGLAGNSKSASMPILAAWRPPRQKQSSPMDRKRPSAEMEPFAKIRVLGVDDIAAYFARQKMEPTPVASAAEAVARGRTQATPCVVCHGQDGKGDAAKLIPSLAGQPVGYLLDQMLLFKQDKRNPGDQTMKAMKELMRTIPDSTFADLAAYYSSLR
jgi:cytochrome c553